MRNKNTKSALSEYFDEVFTDEHPSMELGDGAAQRLTLVLSDGTSYSLPYASLNEIYFEPGIVLRLTFSGDETFAIQGVNLDRLFKALCRHEVRSMTQVFQVPEGASEEAVSVMSIERL